MNEQYQIVITVPYIPFDLYRVMHNIPEGTARDMVHDGRIPIQKKKRNKDKVMVDMVALAIKNAPKGARVVVEPSAILIEQAMASLAVEKAEKKAKRDEKKLLSSALS